MSVLIKLPKMKQVSAQLSIRKNKNQKELSEPDCFFSREIWILQLWNYPKTEIEIVFPHNHNHNHYHLLLRHYGTNTLLTNLSQNLASQISSLVCYIFNKEELIVSWVRSEVNTELKSPPKKFSCSQLEVCTWGMISEVFWTDFSVPILLKGR